VTTQNLDYFVGETRFAGFLALPRRPWPRPGVLVLHGGAGLGEHEREQARRLAALGFAAYAPDLLGGPFASREQGMAVIGDLVGEPTALRARCQAALQALQAQAAVDARRAAVIGFCFGGLAALELARSGADIAAAVIFHGGLHTAAPTYLGSVRAKVLVCTGAADPFVTAEHRTAFEAEMTAAGADWRMIVHGGAMHGFTHPGLTPATSPGSAYDGVAAERSWRSMRDLLAEVFG
jgi:dienelactone hydrolase